MANRKISDLTALTAPVTSDLLQIVDISEAAAADKNKKITYGTFLSSAPLGTAAAPSFAFTGDSNTGIYSPGADQVAISTSGTGRVFVNSSGNIIDVRGNGTFTGNATARQTIDFTNTGGQLYSGVESSAGGSVFTDSSAYAGIIGTNNSTNLQFGTNGTIRATITSAGNVGIGTTSPGGTVDIKAAASTAPLIVQGPSTEFARIDSSARLLVGTSSDSGGALFQVNGDRIRIGTAKTPASASATGAAGEICWDANYIYVCTATNTWKRTAIATW